MAEHGPAKTWHRGEDIGDAILDTTVRLREVPDRPGWCALPRGDLERILAEAGYHECEVDADDCEVDVS